MHLPSCQLVIHQTLADNNSDTEYSELEYSELEYSEIESNDEPDESDRLHWEHRICIT